MAFWMKFAVEGGGSNANPLPPKHYLWHSELFIQTADIDGLKRLTLPALERTG